MQHIAFRFKQIVLNWNLKFISRSIIQLFILLYLQATLSSYLPERQKICFSRHPTPNKNGIPQSCFTAFVHFISPYSSRRSLSPTTSEKVTTKVGMCDTVQQADNLNKIIVNVIGFISNRLAKSRAPKWTGAVGRRWMMVSQRGPQLHTELKKNVPPGPAEAVTHFYLAPSEEARISRNL